MKPWFLSAVLAGLIVVVVKIAAAQAPNPWDTPQGRACFERWIAESMAKLNAYNGRPDFNARKPWSINKYGVLEGNAQFGPHSGAAPEDFAQHQNNKYWWMWDHWVPTGPHGYWPTPEWNGAKIEPLRSFVPKCTG